MAGYLPIVALFLLALGFASAAGNVAAAPARVTEGSEGWTRTTT